MTGADSLLGNTPAGFKSGLAGVILAAGKGQRLLPLTKYIPKPMLPVLTVPLIAWLLAALRSAGVLDVVITVNHLADCFQPMVALGRRHGMRIHLAVQNELNGPFGSLLASREQIQGTAGCVVMHGDVLLQDELYKMVIGHIGSRADLTCGVTQVDDGSRYGVVDLDSNGHLARLRQKPVERDAALVNCGIYVISNGLLDQLKMPAAGLFDFEHVVEAFRNTKSIAVYQLRNWRDVGLLDDYRDANLSMLRPHYLNSIGAVNAHDNVWVLGDVSRVKSFTSSETVLLGDGVSIARNCHLSRSIVGDHAAIGPDTHVRDSVLLPQSSVGPKATVVSRVLFD